jgi:endonuclease YncB( thermonuclease family)
MPDAPFIFMGCLLILLLSFTAANLSHASTCPAQRTTERVQVIHVTDGDTIKLTDGRRLRLIGINTPEISHAGQASQALAGQARSALVTLLDRHNRTLNLQYGKQPRDHYGRLLAHAFLDDGTNVSASLLEQGLATALVVPPNTWARDCYATIEATARKEQRGLWALPDYQTSDATMLRTDTRGFRIVRGRINDIRESRHGIWLDLEGPLVIRVDRKDRVNFKPGFPQALAGKTVEVRGWIKADRNGLRVNVRHPDALVVMLREKTSRPRFFRSTAPGQSAELASRNNSAYRYRHTEYMSGTTK